jgi:hypothetical protein
MPESVITITLLFINLNLTFAQPSNKINFSSGIYYWVVKFENETPGNGLTINLPTLPICRP